MRSTTQRRGGTLKPLALSERLTISVLSCGRSFARASQNFSALIEVKSILDVSGILFLAGAALAAVTGINLGMTKSPATIP